MLSQWRLDLSIQYIIDHHKNILDDIQIGTDKVVFSVKAVIGQIKEEKELNENIKDLINTLEKDKSDAWYYSMIGAVAPGGLVPVIWQGSMFLLTVTNPVVAGGAFLSASAIACAAGSNFYYNQLDKQNVVSNYKVELEKLDIVIKNLNVAMEQYSKALNVQKTAREKSQNALSHISSHLGSFLNIKNSILPIPVKKALYEEIDKILNNYNQMIAFLDSQPLSEKVKNKNLLE